MTLTSSPRPDPACFTAFTPTHEPVSGWDLHRGRETITNSTEYSTKLYTDEAGLGLAHTVALCCRPSTSYQTHYDNRYRFV